MSSAYLCMFLNLLKKIYQLRSILASYRGCLWLIWKEDDAAYYKALSQHLFEGTESFKNLSHDSRNEGIKNRTRSLQNTKPDFYAVDSNDQYDRFIMQQVMQVAKNALYLRLQHTFPLLLKSVCNNFGIPIWNLFCYFIDVHSFIWMGEHLLSIVCLSDLQKGATNL